MSRSKRIRVPESDKQRQLRLCIQDLQRALVGTVQAHPLDRVVGPVHSHARDIALRAIVECVARAFWRRVIEATGRCITRCGLCLIAVGDLNRREFVPQDRVELVAAKAVARGRLTVKGGVVVRVLEVQVAPVGILLVQPASGRQQPHGLMLVQEVELPEERLGVLGIVDVLLVAAE
ncbi:unnamed protein product, partial [marine sediment metagenome]